MGIYGFPMGFFWVLENRVLGKNQLLGSEKWVFDGFQTGNYGFSMVFYGFWSPRPGFRIRNFYVFYIDRIFVVNMLIIRECLRNLHHCKIRKDPFRLSFSNSWLLSAKVAARHRGS